MKSFLLGIICITALTACGATEEKPKENNTWNEGNWNEIKWQ